MSCCGGCGGAGGGGSAPAGPLLSGGLESLYAADVCPAPGFAVGPRDLRHGAVGTGVCSYATASFGRSSGRPGVGSQLKSLGIVPGVQAGLSAILVVSEALSSFASLGLKPVQPPAQAVKA